MLAKVLRYLGVDEESKRQRLELERNLSKADSQLDHLQVRLDEHSRIHAIEKKELDKSLTESDFGGTRKRSSRAQG